MTNERNCLLAARCKVAGTSACMVTCDHFIRMESRVNAANLPADYRLVTLSNSPARADQPQVYANLDNYIKTFARQFEEGGQRIKSIYLYSESPGTGKTTTAAALLNEWLTVHYLGSLKRGHKVLQTPAYFLDVNAWQTLYNEFNRPRVPDSIAEPAAAKYYRAMEKARSAPFAVLDDVGVRDCTDGFRADLHAIINERVTQQLPTAYTSNLPIRYDKQKAPGGGPYDLEDVFGEKRLADRISDLTSIQKFGGSSKRGRR